MTVCALRSAVQIAARAFLRVYNRFDVMGRENLPAGESFLMVCNHSSHFDALCLLASLPLRRVHRAFPAAAADYFFCTPLRTPSRSSSSTGCHSIASTRAPRASTSAVSCWPARATC